MWLHPDDGGTLSRVLRHANGADDALAKTFALATPSDVARVWIDGVGRSGIRGAHWRNWRSMTPSLSVMRKSDTVK